MTNGEVLVKAIVKQQRAIIGPLAVNLANKVVGLNISDDLAAVKIDGDLKVILSSLVSQYQKLFGQASVEACKESVREVGSVSSKDLPAILQ